MDTSQIVPILQTAYKQKSLLSGVPARSIGAFLNKAYSFF